MCLVVTLRAVLNLSAVAWDRVVDLDLLRHLAAVARRRGLGLGWIDVAGAAAMPHAGHDPAVACPRGDGCIATVRAALREPRDWFVVSPHPNIREIAAPVIVGGAVVGALLAGPFGESDDGAPSLNDGEIALFGELLAAAAREVALHGRTQT